MLHCIFNLRYHILLALFSCLGNWALGQRTFSLNTEQEITAVAYSFFDMRQDSSNTINYLQITDSAFETLPKHASSSQALKPNVNYWIKMHVKNTSNKSGQWVLEFREIPYVDVYIPLVDGKFTLARAGNLMPVSQKQVHFGIRENILIELNAKQSKVLYIRLRVIDSIQDVGFMSISGYTPYTKRFGTENLQQGLFHGLLWMMLIYNLFLFISVRERSYLYYVIYVFCSSAAQLYIFNFITYYLFPEYPIFNNNFDLFFPLSFVFYYLLMREFSNSANEHPRLDAVIRYIIGINIAFTILNFFVKQINNDTSILLGLLFHFANQLVLLTLVFVILKIGNRVSKFFVVGTFVLILGTLIIILGMISGTDSDLIKFFFQAGIVGEVFIFSIGLSYKHKISEEHKRKAQDELIQQLKTNQELQSKVNRELEQKVKERTTELHKKNKKITDSIQYAKRIQTAMLPETSELEKIIPKHFVLFRPKDIVSGDFYWAKQIGSKLVVAAADSTGHGVPGAFVSMLGISLLNEIVGKQKLSNASSVLEEMRKNVKASLKQTTKRHSSKDGMDIALVIIDLHNNILQFSGAYNPLYVVRNNELIEIKATRNPIGIHLKEKPFENHEIQLLVNDRLFMFSDGYVDQFGGKNGQKYMAKKFKKLLLSTSQYSLSEQKETLNTTIEDWKKQREQNDDMVILGIEI